MSYDFTEAARHRGVCVECGLPWPCRTSTDVDARVMVFAAIHRGEAEMRMTHDEVRVCSGRHELPLDECVEEFERAGWTFMREAGAVIGMTSP